MTTKIIRLDNGNVQVDQEGFGDVTGEHYSLSRLFRAQGSYVYEVFGNGLASQVCRGLRPIGPTLMVGDDLEQTIRKTLGIGS